MESVPEYSGRQGRPHRSAWTVIGTVLAVLLIIGGLITIGAILLAVVVMQSLGTNK